MILSDHLIELNIHITAISRQIAKRYLLSFSQYSMIMKIDSSGIPVSKLATILGLDKSTLTRNINVLIERDIVEKIRDNSDFRIYNIFLSNKGENIKKQLYLDLDYFTNKLLALSKNNLKDQLNLLDKLIQELNKREIS